MTKREEATAQVAELSRAGQYVSQLETCPEVS